MIEYDGPPVTVKPESVPIEGQLTFAPLEPKDGTVRKGVLNMLRHYPYGLCRQDFAEHEIYEVSARVGELQKDGWVITTKICERHMHRTRIIEYRLGP